MKIQYEKNFRRLKYTTRFLATIKYYLIQNKYFSIMIVDKYQPFRLF